MDLRVVCEIKQIPYDLTGMWTLRNELKKMQTHRYTEQTDMYQKGEGLWGWVTKVKG